LNPALTQDTEFSTYATFWIKQSIIRNIVDKEFLVRIPVHLMEKLIKVQGIETKLGETIDYDDKISLIAQETNSSPNQVENYLTIASAFLHMPSLDIPVGEEDTVLSSFIPDDKIKSTEEEVMNKTLHEDLEKLFSRYLKKREIKILKLRYGLEDGTYHTLQEVGDRYGVTRERIRQIEAKAILKLKKTAKRMNLLDYLES
jgi:RNA polymerase primary sigma factor